MERWTEELRALDGPRRAALEFLRESLPHSDLDSYPFDLFLAFADHALMLRETAPWCAALSEELFCHYVLCPRVNDEDLSPHRVRFYVELWGRVKNLGQEDAALEVNRWCHERATYQATDERTASPLSVYRSGVGRCGEESVFLVAALRSVGLAARQVYAPRWSHCDDNHAWVEVLCEGAWRFLGACEPEPILDRGWFNTAASRAVLVHSRTFGRGTDPLHGKLLGMEGGVAWYNQTARYAQTERRTVRITGHGNPVAGARIELQILNEASFHTVAVLLTGPDGSASAELGRGDVWVRASKEGAWAEGLCAESGLTLELGEAPGEDEWRDFGFRAPRDYPVNPAPLSEAQKAMRAAVRAAGDALRAARMEGCYDEEQSRRFSPRCAALLREARGNFDEICAFLCVNSDPLREELLLTLSAKDLRDVTADTLEDHLQGARPYAGSFPREVFRSAVLCPRIAQEPLTPWRALMGTISDIIPDTENYENLYWPPEHAETAGRCDAKSLAVLSVAWSRSRGVPARLRESDGVVELWDSWAFRPAEPEKCAPLTLVKRSGTRPVYGATWTLSRRTEEGWLLLRPDGEWDGDEYHVRLPLGAYRLVSSVRLPSGDQLAALRDFSLIDGGMVRLDLRQREYALEDALYRRSIPPVSAVRPDGSRVENAAMAIGCPALLFWLEDGAEPTEHVLGELASAREQLQRMPVAIQFFLRSPAARERATLAGVLSSWPDIRVFLDDWSYDLETLCRHLGCDPEHPPLAVVLNGDGEAVYAECGYRVGLVELLVRAASRLLED